MLGPRKLKNTAVEISKQAAMFIDAHAQRPFFIYYPTTGIQRQCHEPCMAAKHMRANERLSTFTAESCKQCPLVSPLVSVNKLDCRGLTSVRSTIWCPLPTGRRRPDGVISVCRLVCATKGRDGARRARAPSKEPGDGKAPMEGAPPRAAFRKMKNRDRSAP